VSIYLLLKNLVFIVLLLAEGVSGDIHVHELEYPLLAAQSGTEGIVTVRCELEKDGQVRAVKVLSGPRILADAAAANALKWRFPEPKAQKDTEIILTYDFQLRGTTRESRSNSAFVFNSPNHIIVSTRRPYITPSSRSNSSRTSGAALGRGRSIYA
jgi:TonB family protein